MSEHDDGRRPKLGEWCITVNEASKYRHDLRPEEMPKGKEGCHNVEWKHRCIGWEPQPVKSMYIGYRMKREGMYWTQGWGGQDWDDSGWEQCFKCEKSIEVWMFVKNERSKPFPVFPQDVERITTIDK